MIAPMSWNEGDAHSVTRLRTMAISSNVWVSSFGPAGFKRVPARPAMETTPSVRAHRTSAPSHRTRCLIHSTKPTRATKPMPMITIPCMFAHSTASGTNHQIARSRLSKSKSVMTKNRYEKRLGRSVQFTVPAYAVRPRSTHAPIPLPIRRTMRRATSAYTTSSMSARKKRTPYEPNHRRRPYMMTSENHSWTTQSLPGTV